MKIFSRTESAPDAFETPTEVLQDISGTYTIDASHSRLGFSARHAMVTTVRGAFTTFEGAATIDSANPANSRVQLTIQADSFDTGNTDRDGHVKSADFFDVENFPTLTFTSTAIKRDGAEWTIVGNLTIKDIAKPVSLVFEQLGSSRDPFGNLRVGFEGGATVHRQDWDLVWNVPLETGGLLVSDKVKLDFDISAIQATTA
ncbi:MAG: YceI family protein [Nocardioides sp.]